MSRAAQVSVIIIVHNGGAFLAEAIESVRRQSATDWELLVVDDGSTDGSRDIAARAASADPRVRSLAHPDGRNHGMSATRNLGLAQSEAELVGFLDADDVWEPTKLQEQLATFGCHPDIAMVYGRTLIWHSWDPDAEVDDHFFDLGVPPDRVHLPPRLFRNLVRNEHQTPTTCNALLRRSAVDAVGGFEPTFEGMFEDQVFFAKVLLRFPVYVSDRCWAKYRQHTASNSARSAAGTTYEHHLRYLRWLRAHPGDGGGLMGNRVALERMLLSIRFEAASRRLRAAAAGRR